MIKVAFFWGSVDTLVLFIAKFLEIADKPLLSRVAHDFNELIINNEALDFFITKERNRHAIINMDCDHFRNHFENSRLRLLKKFSPGKLFVVFTVVFLKLSSKYIKMYLLSMRFRLRLQEVPSKVVYVQFDCYHK